MAEELNTNPTPPTVDAPITPVETPTAPPIIEPQPLTSPAPQPIAPASAEATADKPAEATPAPVSPPPAPAPTPPPAPETNNSIQRLLVKAKEKIQFRKQAKLEKIVVFAKAQGGIANDQTQKILRVSDATATRYLVQLTKNGRLRLVGKSKAARYIPVQ